MDKQNLLIQLDPDAQPSTFDAVVAADAGADQIFRHGSVTISQVQAMVHGAIFTRGPKDLHRTAIFVGGSEMSAGEALYTEAKKHLLPAFGLRVSIMLDPNGSNTTAAAAVHAAGRHCDLSTVKALVLGATGPVGQRAVRLLAGLGAEVRVGSRQRERAEAICENIRATHPNAKLEAIATANDSDAVRALADRQLIIAAGAAGVILLPAKHRKACASLKVVIDLNAVPPLGIEGIDAMDRGIEREGTICYGALGIGGTKMKIHRACIRKMFESNQHLFDAEEIYAVAQELSVSL